MDINTCLCIVFLSLAACFAAAQDDNNGASHAPNHDGDGGQFNYLALRDHVGPSGVPLGGIGIGCVDLAPDGHFTRIGLNNWCPEAVSRLRDENPELERGSFLALWEGRGSDGITRRLVRDTRNAFGMRGFDHTTYRGLFPTARISFDDSSMPQPDLRVSLHAYSGLIPHNVKDSSLPCFWVEVTLANPMGDRDIDASIAFSWTDVISRGILDVRSLDVIKDPNSAFDSDEGNMVQIPHVPTQVQPLKVGDYSGARQFTQSQITLKKATFQNYVQDVAILAQSTDGAKVTYLPAWDSANGDASWKSFRDTGEFPSADATQPLSVPTSPAKATAIAIKANIRRGGKRTFRFLLAWYTPELKPDRVHGDPRSYFGTGDYGRYFQNYFDSFESLTRYAVNERQRILDATQEWQQPILESTLPDWLQFKLINSAYTLYTQTILNKAGNFNVMEGGMGGLAGTMDQRLSAHPFYQKFFTQLDRNENQRFGDCQDSEGGILHFNGHYYWGLAASGGPAPTPKERMVDNAASWLIQIAKDYQQTGDLSFVEHNNVRIHKAFEYLKNQIKDDSEIPVGAQTYDDYPHPTLYSYLGGLYPATLQAGVVLGKALKDPALTKDCETQCKKSTDGFIRTLWNGRFFAYGADLGGKNRRDDRVFTGQLAGQFLGRYCGWGDVVPFNMTQASLITQFKTSVGKSPNFYAPKIWDLDMNRGVDMPASQCWPFYLESYTAMAAIQAGYVADGLNIIRNIQLVHLRNGWTWSQNLWNPDELPYMTAPVTWFITDVLSGVALDVPSETLSLGPVNLPGQRRSIIPLYFPRFWATIEVDPSQKKACLRITKTFGKDDIVISSIRPSNVGLPTTGQSAIKIPRFEVHTGRVLDLSHLLPKIHGITRDPVLSRPGEVPFMTVPLTK